MNHRGVGGFVCTDRVVFNRLTGAVLHQRNMFMCRRVIDDLRLIRLKYLKHFAAVADGADQRHQVQLRICFPQFQLDAVGVVFVNIKDNQLSRLMRRDLAAQLAANRTASACDQDGFIVDESEHLAHVRANRFAAQQVLHGHRLHRADRNLPEHQLIHAGQLLQLAVRLIADV